MASILVCTEGEDLLAAMRPVLRETHHVVIVARLADAIRHLLVTRFDAVVIDMEAEPPPRLDLLSTFASLCPEIPTLAVSPSTEVMATLRLGRLEAILGRPLRPGELERRLRGALDLPGPAGVTLRSVAAARRRGAAVPASPRLPAGRNGRHRLVDARAADR